MDKEKFIHHVRRAVEEMSMSEFRRMQTREKMLVVDLPHHETWSYLVPKPKIMLTKRIRYVVASTRMLPIRCSEYVMPVSSARAKINYLSGVNSYRRRRDAISRQAERALLGLQHSPSRVWRVEEIVTKNYKKKVRFVLVQESPYYT